MRYEMIENEIIKLNDRINSLERTQGVQGEGISQIIESMKAISRSMMDMSYLQEYAMKRINNLYFEIKDDRELPAAERFFFPKIVPAEQAIQKIIDEKKSLARFGDGEFAVVAGRERSRFQNANEKLAIRLKEVLRSDMPDLMIAIADNYGKLDKYTDQAADAIRDYMQPDIREEHLKWLSREKTYYDAYMTRPYVIYRDKSTDAPKQRFEHLKQIWERRNVLMIEGTQTRFGVGNDLLAGARSIRRILIPPKNAFDRYDEILNKTLEVASDDNLILIAAGPTAGVLAYDLTLNGYQALDIGHVDIEYEWFLRGATGYEPIATKYTNDIMGQEDAVDIKDPVYEAQIIGDLS